ncbi:MAG: hypothetical protein GEV09_07010 [Pseudonocardiaceae bacterium]|nr:hypothetical protein [Pseudonocardiaceae bacterium]
MSQESPDSAPTRAELEHRLDAARHELQELQAQMETIKEEIAADVDSRWASMWRTPEVFDLKVSARLSADERYQSLLGRAREAQREADSAAAELDRTDGESS